MIRTIHCKESDRRHISTNQGSFVSSLDASHTQSFDYSNRIVLKPWGYEFLVFENEFVSVWMLHIVRKRKTSVHCHPNKLTSLTLLSGEATFYCLDGDIELKAMDGLIIEKGAFHSTEAHSSLPIEPLSENGIWVLEIESPPMKTDLVRMKDAYGRQGKSYEGQKKIVYNPEIFQLNSPKDGEAFSKHFNTCRFIISKGLPTDGEIEPGPKTLISVVGNHGTTSPNPYLKIGELALLKDFIENTRNENLNAYTLLTIEENKLMRVSDYIFSKIAELGVKDVFTVSGGAAMHLLDSLGKNPDLNYICTHHEQAAAMAAEAYSSISGKPGVALVTGGPGGTNAITGVCGAWINSIPSVFVSGQVVSHNLIEDTGLRQYGIQESDIVTMVQSITKYAACVKNPDDIRFHMEKAVYLATTGRPGPVWLDIPLDVQGKLINPDSLRGFSEKELMAPSEPENNFKSKVADTLKLLKSAKRPVLIIGHGIRLAGASKEVLDLINTLNIPVIPSWLASDMIPNTHECFVGRCGIFGDRAGNFAVQNSDLILSIGCRLCVPQIGYNHSQFAREAKKIVVDIDEAELKKPSLTPDLPIQADAKVFMRELLDQAESNFKLNIPDWKQRCTNWKGKYPVVLPEYGKNKKNINSFHFIDVLSDRLKDDAIVITDMGTSFTCTMQTFKTKIGQRLYTSSGHASMGFGLPGAIGACVANNCKQVICVSGDGGLQMNIQELQTIVHNKFPIILFVLNNRGYLTIQAMQQNHFGRYVGSEAGSGVTCPDIVKVGKAYGIDGETIENQDQLKKRINLVLSKPGPYICEIIMEENQPLIPRISSLKKPDGTVISKPLEDLFPFLDRDEFCENMIVKPVEILASPMKLSK